MEPNQEICGESCLFIYDTIKREKRGKWKKEEEVRRNQRSSSSTSPYSISKENEKRWSCGREKIKYFKNLMKFKIEEILTIYLPNRLELII